MSDAVLTPDRILEAAEDVLRRFGPSKATVVDVARVLDVSHGSVYRHFPSKAALRDAVMARWLARIEAPLHAVVGEKNGSAPKRLRRWFDLLMTAKRRLAQDDPELFATYVALAAETREVIRAHVDELVAQIAQIIGEGVARGEFVVDDAEVAAQAVKDATSRFTNPLHAADWADSDIDRAFDRVWAMILKGLGARKRP